MSNPNAAGHYDRLPESKEELLERIREAWEDLEAVIAGLPEELMVARGVTGWSVRDNLAHVAAWEQYLLGRYLHGLPAHEVLKLDEETLRGLDDDGLNQVLHDRNKDRPTSEVLDEFRRSHQQLMEALDRMSWDDLMAPYAADDAARTPVLERVVGNTYDHYREHHDNIVRLQTPSVLGD